MHTPKALHPPPPRRKEHPLRLLSKVATVPLLIKPHAMQVYNASGGRLISTLNGGEWRPHATPALPPEKYLQIPIG